MKYTQFNPHPFEIHSMAYDLVEPGSTVLDIGCASGYFAKALQKKHCHVTGVDIDRKAVANAKKYCDSVVAADMDTEERKRIPKKKYDYILLLDIIEHLKQTDTLLIELKKRLSKNGKIIISTPNIAHLSVRLRLLAGHFDYTEYGLLDSSHIHFFTKKTLAHTLHSHGLTIHTMTASADFGQIPVLGKFLRRVPKIIQYNITKLFPAILGVQWLAVATRNI